MTRTPCGTSRSARAALEAALLTHPDDLPTACFWIARRLRELGIGGVRGGILVREACELAEGLADEPTSNEPILDRETRIDSSEHEPAVRSAGVGPAVMPESAYADLAAHAAAVSAVTQAAEAGPSPACREALRLLARGDRPIPLHPAGAVIGRNRDGTPRIATGKEPIGEAWGLIDHTPDSLREIYANRPDAGLGLLLGLDGGVVDLEIDDAAAAVPVLARIFGPAGPPDTARWRSTRGWHYLFAIDPEIAARLRSLGITGSIKDHPAYPGVELRLGTLDPAHPRQEQSACPPTPLPDGTPRRREGGHALPFPGALLDDLARHFAPEVPAPKPRPRPRAELVGLTPLEKFKAQLVALGHDILPCDEGFTSQCTAHADTRPSMTFRADERGRLLVFCHRCGDGAFEAIVRGAGLEPADVSPRDWNSLAGFYVAELEGEPDRLDRLAATLGVTREALKALRVGLRRDRVKDGEGWVDGLACFTFPEVDGRGAIVGILRRYLDEARDKKAIKDSRRGLIVPRGFAAMPGPILVVEGPTDVAALLAVGRCAVGRPSAGGGVAHLVDLLRDDPREVVVVGENDRKPDGSWPGRDGAIAVARGLARRLGRDVKKILPPAPFKDMRSYLSTAKEGPHDVR